MAPPKSWMTSVQNQVMMQVEAMMPEFNQMVVKLETMASLVHAKGVKMAQDVVASKALADLSF